MEDQKKRVYDALDKLKIKYEVVEHEPVHTMEDMDRLGLPEKGTLSDLSRIGEPYSAGGRQATGQDGSRHDSSTDRGDGCTNESG